MQAEFGKNSHITIRQIGEHDWADYRDFYKSLSDPHHFSGLLAGKDWEDPATWQDLLKATAAQDGFVMFGMYDRDKMIGQTSIQMVNSNGKTAALLAGSEIADDYRGQRLVDKLYQARREYLNNAGFPGEILTTIRPENTRSRTAAARNGFIDTGRTDDHGYCIYTPETPG